LALLIGAGSECFICRSWSLKPLENVRTKPALRLRRSLRGIVIIEKNRSSRSSYCYLHLQSWKKQV
jgi:hypothetical protein